MAAADGPFITDLGEAMDVNDGDVPRAFCSRLITGITRGQLDYREFAALQSGEGVDKATLSKFAKIVSDPGLAPDYRPLD